MQTYVTNPEDNSGKIELLVMPNTLTEMLWIEDLLEKQESGKPSHKQASELRFYPLPVMGLSVNPICPYLYDPEEIKKLGKRYRVQGVRGMSLSLSHGDAGTYVNNLGGVEEILETYYDEKYPLRNYVRIQYLPELDESLWLEKIPSRVPKRIRRKT